jgi:hypothetical protein
MGRGEDKQVSCRIHAYNGTKVDATSHRRNFCSWPQVISHSLQHPRVTQPMFLCYQGSMDVLERRWKSFAMG